MEGGRTAVRLALVSEDDGAVRTELAVSLRELAWAIHRQAPERAGVGPIPTTEIALLKQIIDNPGSTVGDLAQSLGLRQPNVSASLRSLIQRGFVDRRQSETDRRTAAVFATNLGITEHQEISADWSAPVQTAIAELTPAEVATLAAAAPALEAILRRLRQRESAGV